MGKFQVVVAGRVEKKYLLLAALIASVCGSSAGDVMTVPPLEPYFDLTIPSNVTTKNALLREMRQEQLTTYAPPNVTANNALLRILQATSPMNVSTAQNVLIRNLRVEEFTGSPLNSTSKNSLLRLIGENSITTAATSNLTTRNSLLRAMAPASFTTAPKRNATTENTILQLRRKNEVKTTPSTNATTSNMLLRIARDVETTEGAIALTTPVTKTAVEKLLRVVEPESTLTTVSPTNETTGKNDLLRIGMNEVTTSPSNTTSGNINLRLLEVEKLSFTALPTANTTNSENLHNRNMPGVTPENNSNTENQTGSYTKMPELRRLGTTPNTTTIQDNTQANHAAASRNEKLTEKAKDCDWMTEKERKTVISLQVTGKNLTVERWFAEADAEFRRGIAQCLTSTVDLNITFSGEDLAYVKPSPKDLEDDTLQIYVFLRNGKIVDMEKRIKVSNETDETARSLMKLGVIQAIKLNVSKSIYEAVEESVTNGLPWPDCNSLFTEYLYLWITLAVLVILLIIGSAVLTWYCWRRGKSVELKTHKGISLPTTDELCCTEVVTISGHDNPAMDINGEEQGPPKKKQAPLPPTPEMTTFGKTTETAAVTEYETAIAPYELDTSSVPQDRDPSNGVQLQDTKF
ncbi:uncharacterized protein LOC120328251 [Styela clava]